MFLAPGFGLQALGSRFRALGFGRGGNLERELGVVVGARDTHPEPVARVRDLVARRDQNVSDVMPGRKCVQEGGECVWERGERLGRRRVCLGGRIECLGSMQVSRQEESVWDGGESVQEACECV